MTVEFPTEAKTWVGAKTVSAPAFAGEKSNPIAPRTRTTDRTSVIRRIAAPKNPGLDVSQPSVP